MKQLKLLFTVLFLAVLGLGNVWGAEPVTFSFGFAQWDGITASFSGNTTNEVTQTKGGVVCTYTRNGSNLYANSSALRFYKSNTLTFDAPTGYKIIAITFSCSSYQTDITANPGTCSATSEALSWTNESGAESVSFTRPSNASSYATISGASVTLKATTETGDDSPAEITPNNTFFQCNAFTNKPSDFTSATGTKGKVTIIYTAATNAYINDSQCRLYNGTKLTFSVPDGYEITAIAFTADGNNWGGTHTASVGTMTNNKNWSGKANEVTITFGNTTCRCTKITVTYAAATGSNPDPEPTCSTPTITFAEESVDKLTTDAAFTNAASVEYESAATGQTITWSVEDGKEGVATVNASTGEVTIVGAGEAKIYASVATEGDYCEESAYYTLTVTAPVIKHDVIWSVNGATTSEQVAEGATITFKEVTENIPEGMAFRGWVAAPIVGTLSTEPTYVTSATMGTDNLTYYAVFATKSDNGGEYGGSGSKSFSYSDFTASGDGWACTINPITVAQAKGNVSTSYVTLTEGYYLTISCASGYKITEIDFTAASTDYTGNLTDVTGLSTTSWQLKVDNPGSKTTCRLTAVKVTYEEEVTYSDFCTTIVTPTVEKPTLSVAAGEYWGTQNVKVSNYNSENTYYYTLNGDEPDNTSTAYVDAEGITISASATLKVIAYNGTEASSVASAEYTIKPQFASLEELVAATVESGTEVQVSFSNVKIKSFYTSSSDAKTGVYFDIQKEGKDIEIYINKVSVPSTWEVNGKLSVENLTCKWVRYVNYNSEFQCWELTPTSWDGFTYTAAPTLDHVVVSGDATKKEYIAGEKFNPAGLTVTAYDTENTPEVVTSGITWEVSPERVDADVTSVSVKATYGGKTSEAYTVSGLTTTAIPNGTIAGFISNEGGRCYLTGVVSEIVTSGTSADKKCKLINGESSITIYGILAANRTATTFSALGIEEGDKIKVIAEEYELYHNDNEAVDVEFVEEIVLSSIAISGDLSNTTYTVGDAFNYNGLTATGTYTDGSTSDLTSKVTWSIEPATLTAELTSVTVKATLGEISNTKTCEDIVVNKKTSAITIADMEMGIADANVAIEATTTPAGAALTYTIVSGEDYITLADGKVSAKAEGTAVVKASFAGNDEYAASDKDFNIKVSNILIAKKLTFVNGDNSGSHNFTDNTDISFEAFKGNANNAPGFYNNGIRLYQGGGYVVVKGIKGVKIQSVELTTTSTYSTTVGVRLDNGTAPTSGDAVAAGTTKVYSDLNNDSVAFYCLGATSSTRLEIASLIVKYTKEVIALDHITLSGTYTTEFIQNSTFNHDGVVVTATYADNEEQVVTSSAVFSTPDLTTTGTKAVTVTYTEGGIEKTASYDITVTNELATKLTLGGEYPTRFSEGDAFSHEGLTVKADYNSGRKNIDVTEAVVVSTPDMTAVGTQTVTVSYTYNENTITEDYTILVVPASAVFYESFDTNDGTGANDGQWSGSISSNTLKYDNEGWSCVSTGGANKCAKFGAGNTKGSAETPAIAAAGDFKLTFKAAAWNSNNEATKLNISATGATVKTTSVTLVKGEWSEYTVYITNATTGFKVKFEAAQASNNRFFLDEVMIQGVLLRELNGMMGTHCYPFTIKAGDYEGASFYVPAYRLGTTKLYWDEVAADEDIEAGHPYLIVPDEDATAFEAVRQANSVVTPVAANNMVGTFDAPYMMVPANDNKYIVYENEFRLAGNNVAIGQYRAYIDLMSVTDHEVAPAPGRRRIVMNNADAQVATGLENLNENENVNKVMINGQIFILRDGKVYNVSGQLVK